MARHDTADMLLIAQQQFFKEIDFSCHYSPNHLRIRQPRVGCYHSAPDHWPRAARTEGIVASQRASRKAGRHSAVIVRDEAFGRDKAKKSGKRLHGIISQEHV